MMLLLVFEYDGYRPQQVFGLKPIGKHLLLADL